MQQLFSLIRDVQDYPKPGIVFKDFTPLLQDPRALALAVELMVNPYRRSHVDVVVGAESRGFIFGTAIAQTLSAGFVPVRKPRKLPRQVHSVTYDLEYGTDTLEMHADALRASDRVLVVDDLLATGGTLTACTELVRKSHAQIVGISVLIELVALRGRERLVGVGDVHSVLKYEG